MPAKRSTSKTAAQSTTGGEQQQQQASLLSADNGTSTLLKLSLMLIVCLVVMAFAGTLSVQMMNKQIEVTKLKLQHEAPDDSGVDGLRASLTGVLDTDAIAEHDLASSKFLGGGGNNGKPAGGGGGGSSGGNTNDVQHPPSPLADIGGDQSPQSVAFPSQKRKDVIQLLARQNIWGNRIAPPLMEGAGTNKIGEIVGKIKRVVGVGGANAPTDLCALEMMPSRLVVNASTRLCTAVDDEGTVRSVALDQCTLDRPARQGNLTTQVDLKQFSVFPSITDIFPEMEASSNDARLVADYWADYPTGLFPKCANYRQHYSQFAFHALYTLRRWFRVHKWLDGSGTLGRGDVLIVNQFTLEFHDVHVNVFSEPPDPKQLPTRAVRVNSVASLSITPASRLPNILWFLNVSFDPSAEADYSTPEGRAAAAKGGKKLSVILLEAPKACLQSFLRTVFVLHRPLFHRAFGPLLEPSGIEFDREAYKGSTDSGVGGGSLIDGLAESLSFVNNNENKALPTSPARMSATITRWAPIDRQSVLPQPWPYTPCHKFDQQQLLIEAQNANNMDSMKLFWPFRCDQFRETDKACGQEEAIEARRQGLRKLPLTTAVVFAGFVRSFAFARYSLWENIITPLQATPFAATWNVLGRTKKTETISRKMLVPVEKMRSELASMMLLTAPHLNLSSYIEVFNYFDHAFMMTETKKHGFPHAGLYFLMSKAIQLVLAHDTKFDVIIRARFDIVALAPMRIVRVWKEGRIPSAKDFRAAVQRAMDTGTSLVSLIEDDVEYVMDFGASCELQGLWWPQYTTFHENKILKPPADTRYKFFGWQVCDWMEIGTYNTMKRLGGLMDYIDKLYVFSAAQWVDHNFYISQGIAYQPTQLYLKIIRKRGKYFG